MRESDIRRHAPRVISEGQRDFYFTHGYLLLEGFIADEQLQYLRDIVRGLEPRSACSSSSDFEFETTPTGRRLRQVLCAADHDPALWRYVAEGNLPELAADLLGPDVKFRESTVSFKAPGGRGFDWHQDIVFFPASNPSLLMTLTFLEDVTAEMGPTRVIPGSHRGRVYDHYDREGNWLGLIGEHEQGEIAAGEALDMTGPAGSVLVTHCSLLHSAAPNRSATERPMVIVGYQSADAFSYVELPYRSRYNWTIVKGAPARFVHTEAAELRLPPDWTDYRGVRIDNLYQP